MTRTQLVDVNADTPLEQVARELFYAYCTVLCACGILTIVVA
jgi:hypothetical protein